MSDPILLAMIDNLRRELARIPVRLSERTLVAEFNNSEDPNSDVNCGCFECPPQDGAIIGGCAGAPNGAFPQYHLISEPNPFSDDSGTSAITTFTYERALCGASSSSSSSAGGTGCKWYSCPVYLCNPESSSSSSSSSSSPECGIYYQILELSLDEFGNTVESVSVAYQAAGGGTDWMGAGIE